MKEHLAESEELLPKRVYGGIVKHPVPFPTFFYLEQPPLMLLCSNAVVVKLSGSNSLSMSMQGRG